MHRHRTHNPQTYPHTLGPTADVCILLNQNTPTGCTQSLPPPRTGHDQVGCFRCEGSWSEAQGRSGTGIPVKFCLSTHTPAGVAGGTGTKSRSPVESSGLGRSPATHLAEFSNPPATQGSSRGSTRAQGDSIFAQGLPLPAVGCRLPLLLLPPGRARDGGAAAPQPPLSWAAPGLCSSPARSCGAEREAGPVAEGTHGLWRGRGALDRPP